MYVAHVLKIELGIESRVALGSLWDDKQQVVLIPFHGWVVIGDPLDSGLIIDVTADQNGELPPVVVGSPEAVRARSLRYHYAEAKQVDEISSSSALQRWLALVARAPTQQSLHDFRTMPGLNLSKVVDDDVRLHLRASSSNRDLNDKGRQLIEICLELTNFYSFSSTRTYPRPDHPDTRKRRSLYFLMAGILVSLRTTLENEIRAIDRLLAACPDDESLFNLPQNDLADLIRPAGMPKKRARLIKEALAYSRNNFGENFANIVGLTAVDARDELLRIPGFGPKAADCFLSIGLGIPSAVVDINVFRSYVHLVRPDFASTADYRNARQVEFVRNSVQSSLPQDAFLFQIVHTLLLLFGKDQLGRQKRNRCVLSQICLTCNNPSGVSTSASPARLLNREESG